MNARAALVDGAHGGDAVALDRLLAACRPDLERYARRHCESDDVEEAVQDALWILYRKLGGLRRAAAFTGWLLQIVRRACLGYARARRVRAARQVATDMVTLAAEADPLVVDPALRMALARIIARMPQTYRDAILLRDVEGLSAEEMASRLGISVEAAKSRTHRARAMVRAALPTEWHPSVAVGSAA